MHMGSSEITYKKRIEEIIKSVEDRGVEASLISNEKNIRYLTGFWGKDSQSFLLLSREHKILFTDFRFIKQAEGQRVADVFQWREPRITHFAEKASKIGLRSIAFEDCLPYLEFGQISEALSGINLAPSHNLVENLRKIKARFEINKIREAASIADAIFPSILKILKPGIRELDVVAEIEYQMKKMGAEDRAFDVVVASGMNSSMPHATATSKKIEVYDVVKIDYGAIVDGYCSDITRTVILGHAGKEVIDMYETVKKAQELALGSIRGNISCRELDSIARSYIEEKGYGEKFGHGLGHGVGLDIHEAPFITPSNDQPLEAWMVFTVEPGIYIPGFGGIRIEDMVVLEKDRVEVLTKTSKELIII